jgi:hypothetical protein
MSLNRTNLILIILVLFALFFGEDGFGQPEPGVSDEESTPAEYTDLKKFPKNLAANCGALFSKRNIAPLLVGGAATGIVAPFDDNIRDHVGMAESTTIGKVGSVIGGPAVVFPTVAGLLIGGHYSSNGRFHSFT